MSRLDELRGLVRGSKSVRTFLPDQIPPTTDVRRAIEVARWTGSAKNRQPWRFQLVHRPARHEDLLAACETRASRPLETAPLAVALMLQENGYWFDLGRIVQMLTLSLTALGLDSCVVSLFREDAAARVLTVPSGYRCRFMLAVGYEDTRCSLETDNRVKAVLAHKRRLSVDELILAEGIGRTAIGHCE